MLDWYKTSGTSPTPTTSISSEASLPKAAEQSVSATNTPQDHGEYLRRQLLNQVVGYAKTNEHSCNIELLLVDTAEPGAHHQEPITSHASE